MFRLVKLPSDVRGSLFLSEMPGRHEGFQQFVAEASAHNLGCVVRLTPLDEVQRKSPDYYQALTTGDVPWRAVECSVPDYEIPKDEQLFLTNARRVAEWLRSGENVLIHCGAGVGRTGMLAICTLVALGMPPEVSEQAVSEAGSGPENTGQRAFVQRIVAQLTI